MTGTEAVLIGIIALAVSALGGWPLTAAVLRWAARSRDAGTDPSPARPEDRATDDDAPDAASAPPTGPTAAGPSTSDRGAAVSAAAVEPGPTGPTGPAAPEPPATEPAVDTTAGRPDGAVLRGGTWIGILERLAVTGTLAVGYPEGIAFVIAVKGLGRYPELREHPGLSERFVIGTLASLGWAAAIGAAARAVVV
jgi:hypothetical protein